MVIAASVIEIVAMANVIVCDLALLGRDTALGNLSGIVAAALSPDGGVHISAI